ncbi:MAG: glycosyltransferase family 2 protein [Candidatus Spechtbacterales bacterium]
MLVAINIVAYNEEKNIKKSLESALGQSYKPIEVFLIDNASYDKTAEIAEGVYKNSGSVVPFKILKNSKNLGFGGGHNVGFQRSTGDFILCLNADCELDKNYVKYAVEVFERDKSIAAVQGKLVNPRTDKLDTTGLLFYKNRRVVNRGQGDLDKGQYENSEEIWGVDGAAPVYRRAALEDTKIQVEYFDADFFCYKEDVDLSWRMRLAGWKLMYEPRAIAFHDRSAGEGTAKNPFQIIRARKGISEFAKFHSFANQRLMQVKNETPYLFFKYFPKIFIKELMSWSYVLFFEKYGARSVFEFFRLLPRTIKKRRFVMAKKRISDNAMERWFI